MRILLVGVSAIMLLLGEHIMAASNSEIESFAAEIERPLRSARYMEGKCAPTLIPEWEGFDTTKCSYTVIDHETGNLKTGLVVMLNPSASVLATWILNACEIVHPNENRASCSARVFG